MVVGERTGMETLIELEPDRPIRCSKYTSGSDESLKLANEQIRVTGAHCHGVTASDLKRDKEFT